METNPVPQPVTTPATLDPRLIVSGHLNITTTVDNRNNTTIVGVFSHGVKLGDLIIHGPELEDEGDGTLYAEEGMEIYFSTNTDALDGSFRIN